jgi:hypothetical protein
LVLIALPAALFQFLVRVAYSAQLLDFQFQTVFVSLDMHARLDHPMALPRRALLELSALLDRQPRLFAL